MPLTLYRRHSMDCRVHSLKLTVSEKRFFTDCECPIWINGTTETKKYPRQALGVRDWKAAEAKLRSITAGSKDETVHGPTLADCIKRHLDSHADDVGAKALEQHRLTLERLEKCEQPEQVFHVGTQRRFTGTIQNIWPLHAEEDDIEVYQRCKAKIFSV